VSGEGGKNAMLEVAHQAVALALKNGANEAAVAAGKSRQIEVQWRDGKVEKVSEATTRALGLRLYVDGRFSGVSTSDLRPEALAAFVENAVALTRKIAPDPYRTLPDPELYAGQSDIDLQIVDPRYDSVTAALRRGHAEAIEAAVRAQPRAEALLSVTTSFSDTLTETCRVHSNGFEGTSRETSFWMGAEVSMKDADGRRPEDYAFGGSRFYAELPTAAAVGQEAAARTAIRLGAQKGATAVLPMAVESRVSGQLVGYLFAALGGRGLQQKRSFLEGKLGEGVGSARLSLSDDPLLLKGFGSRLFDDEGIAARPFPVFEEGVLRSYYIDTYYGKKLGMRPTTAGLSNLRWRLGEKDQAGLLADMGEGILVTSFLGGNSNGTTGDFSLGVAGRRVRGGQLCEPIGEMNVSGNQLELWKHLAAVGNDPYPYSITRTPTLVFEGVQFAGT
jgi:PmbA protein